MGIRGQKDVVAVLWVLGKFKFTSCSRSELVARRVINDQVEAMREADISGIALEPWGDEEILDILSKAIIVISRAPRSPMFPKERKRKRKQRLGTG